MRPINFIASYPRSGNTFLRALLANHMNPLGRPHTVNEIAQFGDGERDISRWRDAMGVGAALSPEVQWLSRASYMRAVRDTPGTGAIFLKTHTFNGIGFDRPSFEFMSGDKIVYIVRHPLDVLVSGSDFFNLTQKQMFDRMMLSGAFNQADGLIEATGSWSENVTGWLNEKEAPVLLVRYRDLVRDTQGEFKRVLDFLRIPTTRDHVARAVDYSAFQTLRSSNLEEGFYQGPDRSPTELFFRIGKPDQWKHDVEDSIVEAMSRGCGPLMDALLFEHRRS